MYYETQLSVIVNNQTISTIVKIDFKNYATQVGASCDITVPLNSYIEYSDPNTKLVYLTAIRSDMFPQGSVVEVKASYIENGTQLPTREVFSGFVYDFIVGMPLTIKCLDYIYWFNLGIFGDNQVSTTNKAGTKIKNSGTGVNYKSISFQALLQNLINFVNVNIANSGTNALPVSLILPIFDMPLVNITFINMSPAAILEWFKKELGINITFIKNQLYVNVASNTIGSINLSTKVNVLKSDLQTNLAAFQQIRMKCWFVQPNGTRSWVEVGSTTGIQEQHFFYKVANVGNTYNRLANEALLKAQQHHYKGELELLLYPICDLFYIVNYLDARYPEKNGQYYIIGINIVLSEKGFRQHIKVAWLNLPTYTYLTTGKAVLSS